MNEWLDRFTPDYLDDILVRLAHHSTAIEGNTISLPETVSIILHNTLPSSSGASVREFYEIDNHRQAFEFMMEMLRQDEPLSVALIQEMHSKLTDRLQYDRGQFKKNDNRIVGAEFKTALPAETPGLVIQLVDNLNYRLEVANDDDEKIEAIVDSHIQFERIHPFSDGNGRTGRMIMNYSLLKEKLPPFIVHKSDRGVYIERLANQDVEGLKKMALEEMNQERERMIDFGHTKENEITEIEQELE
ncbi:MAG: Fic family protein [Vagococcus sp.]|uniref:Fic family protein n=1 Tax=Vagococcus sp. TaxID=1933889 RepID=UPI002FC734EB